MTTSVPYLSPLWQKYEVWFVDEQPMAVISAQHYSIHRPSLICKFAFDDKEFSFLFSKSAYYGRKKCVLETLAYLDEHFRPHSPYECVLANSQGVAAEAGDATIFLLDANVKELVRVRQHISTASDPKKFCSATLVM